MLWATPNFHNKKVKILEFQVVRSSGRHYILGFLQVDGVARAEWAETLEEQLLLAVRSYHAAKPYLTLGAISERQHDVSAVNARKFGKDRAGRISQPGTRLPLLECFP